MTIQQFWRPFVCGANFLRRRIKPGWLTVSNRSAPSTFDTASPLRYVPCDTIVEPRSGWTTNSRLNPVPRLLVAALTRKTLMGPSLIDCRRALSLSSRRTSHRRSSLHGEEARSRPLELVRSRLDRPTCLVRVESSWHAGRGHAERKDSFLTSPRIRAALARSRSPLERPRARPWIDGDKARSVVLWQTSSG